MGLPVRVMVTSAIDLRWVKLTTSLVLDRTAAGKEAILAIVLNCKNDSDLSNW